MDLQSVHCCSCERISFTYSPDDPGDGWELIGGEWHCEDCAGSTHEMLDCLAESGE